ncbi:hypothetical protein B0H67DRAFT_638788 [Lasiosphaeris hirsuta]|uniref:Uncharacterized protein n=1 Tax=Lasiosphaeris hirsuta TaxID=260670 RepID=A0AA40BA65_9PEZI|nr:hypothetical protein B0H67DRAFT_638788 [Lasiosphaeris hirsuta]
MSILKDFRRDLNSEERVICNNRGQAVIRDAMVASPGYGRFDGCHPPPGAVLSASGRFAYGEDGFSVDNVQLERPDELEVTFKKSATRPALVDGLEKAVKAGKCNRLSEAVQPMLDLLCQQFESGTEAHAQTVERWADEKFASLQGDPEDEAAVDMDHPLVLNNWAAMAGATQKVPGLRYRKFPRDMVIIGWGTEMERGVEHEFVKLSSSASSTSRAKLAITEDKFDVGLFLKKYLHVQTVNGFAAVPHEKPSALVTLPLSVKMDSYLKTVASDFPGLCVQFVKKSKGERERRIGTDISVYKYTVPRWGAENG